MKRKDLLPLPIYLGGGVSAMVVEVLAVAVMVMIKIDGDDHCHL